MIYSSVNRFFMSVLSWETDSTEISLARKTGGAGQRQARRAPRWQDEKRRLTVRGDDVGRGMRYFPFPVIDWLYVGTQKLVFALGRGMLHRRRQ